MSERYERGMKIRREVLGDEYVENALGHLRGALRNGCTREQIREALIQAAVYAGMPVGVEGFRVARQVLAEEA